MAVKVWHCCGAGAFRYVPHYALQADGSGPVHARGPDALRRVPWCGLKSHPALCVSSSTYGVLLIMWHSALCRTPCATLDEGMCSVHQDALQ